MRYNGRCPIYQVKLAEPHVDIADPIAHWKLDESGSGTRYDAIGSNHLISTNTVAAATGKLNNGAALVGFKNQLSKRLTNRGQSVSMGA